MGWERPLTCEDFGLKPSDFHEIKESEIPKHTMTFDKHATGAAADQNRNITRRRRRSPLRLCRCTLPPRSSMASARATP